MQQNYSTLNDTLVNTLKLVSPPIAVSLVDDLPDGVDAFAGTVPAGCRFWQDAAQGTIATSAKDHELCAIGIHTHNLAGAPESTQQELATALRVMGELDYVRAQDIEKIPVVDRSSRYVVYAPLSQMSSNPDVVLLFANAEQGLIVTEAIQQADGGEPPALGRPACAVVPQVMNSNRAAVSFGCCGARAYLDVLSNDVAIWALPGDRVAVYAERIEALAKANHVLAAFHKKRQADVAVGHRPTVEESLARLG